MKQILEFLRSILDSIDTVRLACSFARSGDFASAKRLYQSKEK